MLRSSTTPFKTELIRIAQEECQLLNGSRRGDRTLEERVRSYAIDLSISVSEAITAHYSAVFISWCLRSAGASKTEFPIAIAHWQYAECAAQSAANRTGVFWARRIESYAPQIGDLIHFNRNGGRVDYDQICGEHRYEGESGIVISLESRNAVVVVGNLEPAGNVGIEKVSLAASGVLKQREADPFICIIEVRK